MRVYANPCQICRYKSQDYVLIAFLTTRAFHLGHHPLTFEAGCAKP